MTDNRTRLNDQQNRENEYRNVETAAAGLFLLYGLMVTVAVSFVLYRLSVRTRKKVQAHDNSEEG